MLLLPILLIKPVTLLVLRWWTWSPHRAAQGWALPVSLRPLWNAAYCNAFRGLETGDELKYKDWGSGGERLPCGLQSELLHFPSLSKSKRTSKGPMPASEGQQLANCSINERISTWQSTQTENLSSESEFLRFSASLSSSLNSQFTS